MDFNRPAGVASVALASVLLNSPNRAKFNRLLGLIFFICLSAQSFAQDASWILQAEKDGVEVYISYNQCAEVTFKVVNTTENSLTVKWAEKVIDYRDDSEIELHEGALKAIVLQSNSSLTGACSGGAPDLITDTSMVIESIGDGFADLQIHKLQISLNQ